MTISSNDRRKEYAGNGATTVFNGPRAFHASDVQVYLVETATGAASLVSTGDYTLTGLGRAATRITMNVAPASGYTLLVLRTVPFNQPTDITNQGAFLPEIHEDAFDRQVMQIQQLGEQMARTLRIADTSVGVEPIDQATPGRFIITTPSGFGVSDTPPLGDLSLRGDLSSSALGGAGLVEFRQPDTDAIARPLDEKLSEIVSVKDFGPAGTGVTDSWATLQKAILATAGRAKLHLPEGEYSLSQELKFQTGTHIFGDGIGKTVLKLANDAPAEQAVLRPSDYAG